MIDAAIIHECAREISRVDPMTAPFAKLPAVGLASRRGPRPVPRGLPATVEANTDAPSLAWERPAVTHLIAKLRSAARAATSALPGSIGEVIAKHRTSARVIAAVAAAALLWVGGMALVRFGPDTAGTTVAEVPNPTEPGEAFTLANFSVPAPPRPAENAATPDIGPAAEAPAAPAAPAPVKPAPTAMTPPSTPQKAAADPNNANAHLQQGNMYLRAKDYAQAIDHYQKAAQLDPQSAEAPFNLGYIYASTGKYASAEQMLMRVVDLKPAYLDKALFNLAVVRQKIGKHQESLAALEAAVAIRPENQKAQAYLNELKAVGREER